MTELGLILRRAGWHSSSSRSLEVCTRTACRGPWVMRSPTVACAFSGSHCSRRPRRCGCWGFSCSSWVAERRSSGRPRPLPCQHPAARTAAAGQRADHGQLSDGSRRRTWHRSAGRQACGRYPYGLRHRRDHVRVSLSAHLSRAPRDHAPRTGSGMVREIAEGSRRCDAALGGCRLYGCGVLCRRRAETVLLPIIGRRVFGSDTVFITSLALVSAGGLVGAIVALRWRPTYPVWSACWGWCRSRRCPWCWRTPAPRGVLCRLLRAGGSSR